MTVTDLRTVLLRDLKGLQRQVLAYPDDRAPWIDVPGLPNSGGTLVLHLVGNLQHFVGAVLGASGYVRDRDAEFSRRDVGRAELSAEVQRTIDAVDRALDGFDAARLAEPYPLELGGKRVGTGRFLMHLVAHLGYHLGQIDYHRRSTAPTSGAVGSVAVTEL